MCTLTYLLNEDGYELFFNRDEQRTRELALPPKYDESRAALYPLDPQGEGTWIAVNVLGLSLALLNNYQATNKTNQINLNASGLNRIISRGQLILSLLAGEGSVSRQLQTIDLTVYQPFKLCIFPEGLSKKNKSVHCASWDGNQLIERDVDAGTDLPITSSSVDFIEVSQKRKQRFEDVVDLRQPLPSQLEHFHYSTEANGKHSVNMQRADAKTVSISHIVVNANKATNDTSHLSIDFLNPTTLAPSKDTSLSNKNEIRFEYVDNVQNEKHIRTFN